MNLRALIVDDEPLARQRLEDLLSDAAGFDVIGICADGLEAVEAISNLSPDVVFLDVQMPGLDGFGVVEAIGPGEMPLTIFVTAYDQYALRAFEARALDYLVKPFDTERFQDTLGRVQAWHRKGPADLQAQMQALLEAVASDRPHAERFLAKSGEIKQLVRVAEIQWIEAEENYVRLHTAKGSSLVRQTMAGILTRLDPKAFRRIHRSHIVNLDFIRELQPGLSGDATLILKDGTELVLTRTYRDQFDEWR